MIRTRFLFVLVLCMYPVTMSVSVHPATPGIPVLKQAQRFEQRGQHHVALDRYEIAFKNHPAHPGAGLGLLRNAVQVERWTLAEEAINGLERSVPHSSRTAKWAARMYYHRQQYDTAMAWAVRYRERVPDGWMPLHFIARIAYRKGRDERAKSALERARIRAPDHPWVNLLDYRVTKRLQGTANEEWLTTALERGTDATLFWEAVQLKKGQWSASRVEEVLRRGIQYLEAGTRPPLRKPVSRSTYRYWIARLAYMDEENSQARRTLASLNSPFRVKWLRTMLMSRPQPKLDAMSSVLGSHPDHPTAQWIYSRLARREEGLPGDHRLYGSKFFFEQYTRNRMLDLKEAAYSSLVRSLELRPVNSGGQFELAKYLRGRGWNQIQRRFLRHADELGFNPPAEVDDYREGLKEESGPPTPGITRAQLGIQVGLQTFWEGPVDGARTLTSMLRQAFYHQPAFVPETIPPGTSSGRLVPVQYSAGSTESSVRIGIRRWDRVLDTIVVFRLPDGTRVERDFQAQGIMKEWKLLNMVIKEAKSIWPWKGRVYETTPNGAWINLGRVHGIDTGDTFVVHNSSLGIDRVHERRARIGFRTPVQETVIPRGATALRKQDSMQPD